MCSALSGSAGRGSSTNKTEPDEGNDHEQTRSRRAERDEAAPEVDRAAERDEEAKDKTVVLVEERACDVRRPAPRSEAEEEAREEPGDDRGERRDWIQGAMEGDPAGDREGEVI